ncbi:MAG TPA: AmmeMemoRadiSam system radical SAM enzyme [Anaerolineae bacterium]|nr:AmmeMemoRadiSam system radical SAM enzyme [Anaerolineae bacterium]
MGKKLTRREFLQGVLTGLGVGALSALGLPGLRGCDRLATLTPLYRPGPTATPQVAAPVITLTPGQELHEARFYRTLADGSVQCQMCFRHCVVREGRLGFCHNKKNVGGRYVSLVYGRPCALQVDPIEKEPAFHMLPGASIFCTGTSSCNNRCKFCQNWEMSQRTLWEVITVDATPEDVVGMAVDAGCQAVSFTYNEPTVFYEYMFDIARLARERGLRALFHTNGLLNREPMLALLEVMNAVTVDLKAFTPEFYQRVCSSELEPVLSTLQTVRETDRHLEVVNLVIPGKNDNPDDIRRMCAWIAEELGAETPLHFIRFFPAYRFQRLPATPIETLETAASIADEEGLQFVYIGNVPGHRRNSTFCPGCGECIIERVHFFVFALNVVDGKCRFCGREIPGIWWAEDEVPDL